MTVMLEDVGDSMANTFQDAGCRDYIVSRDLLYADDTLLADTDSSVLQRLVETVAAFGSEYGLELHWGKTVLPSKGVNHHSQTRPKSRGLLSDKASDDDCTLRRVPN